MNTPRRMTKDLNSKSRRIQVRECTKILGETLMSGDNLL